MKKSLLARKGFTLIELLTVIAIIGILAAIIIPTVGRVRDMANRAAGQSDLRSIAQIYFSYSNEGNRPRNINVTTLDDWALRLASEADLNDASLYYLPFDPEVEGAEGDLPKTIATFNEGTGEAVIDPDFSSFPKSVAVVANLSTRAPSSTTPLAWTAGLEADGTWEAGDASPYRGDGGHIAFVDGHVSWYKNLGDATSGELVDFNTKQQTNNIGNAINERAGILADPARGLTRAPGGGGGD